MFATPEKALLDLLYLNPFYRTEQDMENLRQNYMQDELNTTRLSEYLSKYGSKTLEQRVNCLIKVYGL